MSFRVYFEEEKNKAGDVPATNREHHPPVTHESAWRSISLSITYSRLSIHLSDSGIIRKWSQTLPTTTPSLTSTLPASLPITVQESESIGISISAVKKSLSQEEIERICKAFLRLLQAPLTTEQGVKNDAK